jgi:acyl-CoA reductase-like NAD-dependent aldehyde dehydrogenase
MVQGVIIEDGCLVNTNPATGEVISRVKCTLPEEVDRMVAVANEAQKTWATTPLADRIKMLKAGLAAVMANKDQFCELIVKEMGKPMAEAKEEMEAHENMDEFFQILEGSLQPQTFGSSVVVRQALGVVAILSPWNYPVGEIVLLALPSLASGNTGKFKVASLRMRSLQLLQDLYSRLTLVHFLSFILSFSHSQTF